MVFVPELAPPRAKRRRRKKTLQQQLPVPVASLTDVKPDNAVWRWYSGTLGADGGGGGVTVEDPAEGRMLLRMGFFGEKRRRIEPSPELVKLEAFDPTPLRGQQQDEKEEEDASDDEEKTELSDKSEVRPRKDDDDDDFYVWLDPLEAHFLGYALGCLVTTDKDGKELSLDETWEKFCAADERFHLIYSAYHHFRSKGWVVRRGDKFGADLLLYKHGPPFYHASFSVMVMEEGEKVDWRDLHGANRVTEAAAKELLLARVSSSSPVKIADLKGDAGLVKHVKVSEALVRRWVPYQERENVAT